MTSLSPSFPDLILAALPWLLLGAAVGLAHLASLRWTLALFAASGSLAGALLLQMARLGLVAGTLALAAFSGTAALLATAGALLLARLILLRFFAPRAAAA